MKKVFPLLLALVLLLSVATTAYATGDGNMDGGGGDMEDGEADNYWNPGMDGVRVSIVHKETRTVVCTPIDWTNKSPRVDYHFGKVCKLEYLNGQALMVHTDDYIYENPGQRLPPIISDGGNAVNIDAIESYFTDAQIIRAIAGYVGMDYDELISGEYKLVLEPIAYLCFEGMQYAMTATEAALFDRMTNNLLYYRMMDLTHKNLPLSIFLETPDLGINAWTGSVDSHVVNASIISTLGVGVVSFRPDDNDPEVGYYDYEFRCDTDVIVTFPVYNPGGDITPDDNATLTIDLGGAVMEKSFVCPAGGTQYVWVRWHTPRTPQTLTVTAEGAGTYMSLSVRVSELKENTPPDPTYYDSGPGFSLASVPDYGSCTSTSWGEWLAEWEQDQGEHLGGYNDVYDWVETGELDEETGEPLKEWKKVGEEPWYYTCEGYCEEHGYWEYEWISYSATLHLEVTLEPDDRCQTDYESRQYGTVMPSGYGVQLTVKEYIMYSENADSSDVVGVQSVVAAFPEFGYESYSRLLENTSGRIWQFTPNIYSYYRSRIHFTPLWYPDDTYYPVAVYAFDAWTPGGQLYASGSDRLYIFRSCLDDWYIHIVED